MLGNFSSKNEVSSPIFLSVYDIYYVHNKYVFY